MEAIGRIPRANVACSYTAVKRLISQPGFGLFTRVCIAVAYRPTRLHKYLWRQKLRRPNVDVLHATQ